MNRTFRAVSLEIREIESVTQEKRNDRCKGRMSCFMGVNGLRYDRIVKRCCQLSLDISAFLF